MSNTYSSRKIRNVCVFCGSSLGKDKVYLEAAKHLRQELAHRKINLIYGGGSFGFMGSVAIAAKSSGVEVIGIILHLFAKGNVCGKTIGKEKEVLDTLEHIKTMINRSDVFIALLGGLGTLEDIFIVASRNLLGIHSKPLGLLNVNGFYDGLFKFLDFAVEQNFIVKLGRQIFIIASTIGELLDKMQITHLDSDTITSKLDWEKRNQKRPLDLNLYP